MSVASYSVFVSVTDKGTPARQTAFTLRINIIGGNNKSSNSYNPIFRKDSYVTVMEETSAIGATVETVFADDADTGTNGMISYSLLNYHSYFFH